MDKKNSQILATLAEGSSGQLSLKGQLDYRSGKALFEQGKLIIRQSAAKAFTLDCSAVTRTSSVGVALILSLVRDAQQLGKTLQIKNLTKDLEEIANFTGIKDVLPLASDYQVVS